ncbi:tetraacyldisaccharide 4'-kinase [Echinicola marina]|uniref:tetraacyldisaccharide 4'-kinase n=1 Tax=Echinicola marina TaxID=2859768 RepID=UPI001CF6C0CB|nr:tetraacyldisaccharide 4'-kinase [Echinicola marina]UCS95643.1 tetraacyldisaccharide 4'-kinase [Echinicola marina]
MQPYQYFMYPFSLLYDGITRLRNRMFDTGVKKSIVFEIPTIVVGNLAIGGTGKTPMVEFFVENFKGSHELACLSRGYGRKTQGFILAGSGATADELGDEPFQIFSKYGHEITVAVGEQRILAIPQIIAENPATELVVLDDAFQHRYVKGDMNVLLTTFQKPFFEDHVLPMGTLRESREGAKRADVVVVTKSPKELEERTKQEYIAKIRPYVKKHCPVLFAGLNYGEPYNVRSHEKADVQKVVLVSGIANNKLLKEWVEAKYELLEVLEYSDHHHYNEKDLRFMLERMEAYRDENPTLLTTEKDAVKLNANKFLPYLQEIPIFAVPVQVKFEEKDRDTLLDMASKVIRNKAYQSEV